MAEERVFGIEREILLGALDGGHGAREIEWEAANKRRFAEEQLQQIVIGRAKVADQHACVREERRQDCRPFKEDAHDDWRNIRSTH